MLAPFISTRRAGIGKDLVRLNREMEVKIQQYIIDLSDLREGYLGESNDIDIWRFCYFSF